MSLEQAIEKLTAAVEANTTAIGHVLNRSVPPPGEPAPTSTATPDVPAAPKTRKPRGTSAGNAVPPGEPTATGVGTTAVSVGATEGPPVIAGPAKANAKTIADKFLEVAAAKGRDSVLALLTKYGVARLSELKPEKHADFYAELLVVAGAAPAPVAPAADSLL